MDSTVTTDNDPCRAAIELVRNTPADLRDAEEGNIHHDGAGDGGDAGQGMSAESREAQEGNTTCDGAGDGGDAGQGVPTELQDIEAGVIPGGGNGDAGQGIPAVQDAEEAGVNDDGIGDDGGALRRRRHRRRRGVAVGLLEFFRLLVIYFVRDLHSTTPFSLLKLAKIFLSAVFILVSIAVECLLLQGVVDEARADGIVRATTTASAVVLMLIVVWSLSS